MLETRPISGDGAISLGPFDLHRLVGRGGMAEVWAGEHRAQRVPVAVKVITAAQAKEARFREAFQREVQAVARLHHPGIVMVLDHGTVPEATAAAAPRRLAPGAPYLAMELASWGSLDQAHRPLAWPDLQPILLALLDALGHAHARGVIHRDLKPQNVLLAAPWDTRPGVKLTDFGIAHAQEPVDAPTRAAVRPEDATSGTPMYMAPEQFLARWRDLGPWTDLYALGGLAFLLATGSLPFQGKNLAQLAYDHTSRPPPALPEALALPRGFEGWLHRLLQKDPRDRFQRAADAAHALLALGRPAEPPRPTSPGQAPGPAPEPALRLKGATLPAGLFEPTELHLTQPTLHHPERPAALATVLHETQLAEAMSAAAAPAPPPSAGLCPRPLPPLPASWASPEAPTPPLQLVGAGLSLFGLRAVPVVDREAERDALWAALAEVRRLGESRAVVLRGPAGHGKSRLVEWLTQRADEVGSAQVLRATHGSTPGPAHGLPRMMARMLRSVDLAGPELLERTEAQLRAQGVVDPYEWLALAELMQPGTTDRVRPAQASERHALVGRLLARAAEARPVVVWMEDVQWGADALAFALHLLKLPAPILVLATVREDVLPQRRLEARLLDALLQAEGASELAVLPLADVHHRALIDALLLLDGDLATQVAERTQGNPLFAVQLVGDWVSRGVLEVGPRGFVLKPQERAALPDDIHQMWRQRVARVLEPFPRTALFALEVAAILGHTTEAREWQEALLEASLTVPPLLVIALMENRLAVPTDGGWAFAHGMLRESLVRGAEEAGRAPAHHAACARMLVHRHGHEAPGVAERLGGHHLAGGTPELALYPLRRAAEERLAASEFPQASALVDRRDEALDRMGAGPEDPRRVEGWVLRATILTLRGRFEDADAWARRARDTARRMSWRRILADALAAAGRVAHERGDQGTALNEFDEARRLYAGLGDRAGVARCLLGRGEALYRLGDLERAELVLDEALVLFQAEEDRAGIAQALLRLGVAALWRGRLDEARALCQRQLRVLEGLGDRFQQARCIAALGEVARQAGELDEAERAYRQALAMDEAIGSKSAWMDRLNLGLVLLARGDFAGAQRLSAQVARELGPGAEPSQRCLVLTQRLPSLAHAGDWAAWSVTLTEARLLLEETGLADGDLAWLLELAGAEALARGAVEPAQLVLALAAEQWRALGRPDRAAAAIDVIPSG